MKYTEETWKAQYAKTAEIAAKAGRGASDGIVCIMASLSYMKQGLVADGLPKDQISKAIDELFESLKDPKISNGGFACNASAAMKFAGIKTADKADQLLKL